MHKFFLAWQDLFYTSTIQVRWQKLGLLCSFHQGTNRSWTPRGSNVTLKSKNQTWYVKKQNKFSKYQPAFPLFFQILVIILLPCAPLSSSIKAQPYIYCGLLSVFFSASTIVYNTVHTFRGRTSELIIYVWAQQFPQSVIVKSKEAIFLAFCVNKQLTNVLKSDQRVNN